MALTEPAILIFCTCDRGEGHLHWKVVPGMCCSPDYLFRPVAPGSRSCASRFQCSEEKKYCLFSLVFGHNFSSQDADIFFVRKIKTSIIFQGMSAPLDTFGNRATHTKKWSAPRACLVSILCKIANHVFWHGTKTIYIDIPLRRIFPRSVIVNTAFSRQLNVSSYHTFSFY